MFTFALAKLREKRRCGEKNLPIKIHREKEKSPYNLIIDNREMEHYKIIFAEIAQLVEHNLAKVRVAGSSPVFRSENAAI